MSHYRAQFQKGHGERQFRERYGSEVTGGGPEPVQFAAFTWVNITFGNIKNGIRGTYHAIRRKHVPRYLAQFDCAR